MALHRLNHQHRCYLLLLLCLCCQDVQHPRLLLQLLPPAPSAAAA
jgi:hypothetical protein